MKKLIVLILMSLFICLNVLAQIKPGKLNKIKASQIGGTFDIKVPSYYTCYSQSFGNDLIYLGYCRDTGFKAIEFNCSSSVELQSILSHIETIFLRGFEKTGDRFVEISKMNFLKANYKGDINSEKYIYDVFIAKNSGKAYGILFLTPYEKYGASSGINSSIIDSFKSKVPITAIADSSVNKSSKTNQSSIEKSKSNNNSNYEPDFYPEKNKDDSNNSLAKELEAIQKEKERIEAEKKALEEEKERIRIEKLKLAGVYSDPSKSNENEDEDKDDSSDEFEEPDSEDGADSKEDSSSGGFFSVLLNPDITNIEDASDDSINVDDKSINDDSIQENNNNDNNSSGGFFGIFYTGEKDKTEVSNTEELLEDDSVNVSEQSKISEENLKKYAEALVNKDLNAVEKLLIPRELFKKAQLESNYKSYDKYLYGLRDKLHSMLYQYMEDADFYRRKDGRIGDVEEVSIENRFSSVDGLQCLPCKIVIKDYFGQGFPHTIHLAVTIYQGNYYVYLPFYNL